MILQIIEQYCELNVKFVCDFNDEPQFKKNTVIFVRQLHKNYSTVYFPENKCYEYIPFLMLYNLWSIVMHISFFEYTIHEGLR